MTQGYDTKIESKTLFRVFEFLKLRKFDEAQKLLEQGIKEAEKNQDDLLAGLFYSAYGVFFRLQKEFRKAWKSYEKAEKLVPADPSLKIISARLLLDFFGQYDIVLRKMDKVLGLAKDDFVFVHMAHTIKGMAFLKKGNKAKALESLKLSMGDHFNGLKNMADMQFDLVNELIKKKWGLDETRLYLKEALFFSKKAGDIKSQKIIWKFLEHFP
ncbi:MAG TPA: hypothetical protein DDW49_07695 [Deltaproteobacteria bacterium]|nr:MAG: hypothetical protein A2048_02220 [Deltaproteobacteria bacterium GWA2_45_12]HBF13252.1 hypothetical protein [Deltaproteobacteria bacterium]